jgi:hypothetical protein
VARVRLPTVPPAARPWQYDLEIAVERLYYFLRSAHVWVEGSLSADGTVYLTLFEGEVEHENYFAGEADSPWGHFHVLLLTVYYHLAKLARKLRRMWTVVATLPQRNGVRRQFPLYAPTLGRAVRRARIDMRCWHPTPARPPTCSPARARVCAWQKRRAPWSHMPAVGCTVTVHESDATDDDDE